MDQSRFAGFQQGADNQMTLGNGLMGTARLGQGGDGGTRSPRRAEEQPDTAGAHARSLADDLLR